MNSDIGNSDITGVVQNLSELISYQTGSVVSRTFIKKKTGTVTIFAFDQGQELSEHTAPFDALVQVVDGQLEISIEGTPQLVNQGEILIMPANKPHALKALSASKMLLTMIKEG